MLNRRCWILPSLCLVLAANELPRLASQERRPARPAPVRSPEIAADGRVTFRLRAAQASEVGVNGQWPNGRVMMIKGEGDVWSVTVDKINPGVWEYSFQVDGLAMIDPANSAIKPMRQPRTSILHISGQPLQLFDFQDVPHGTLHLHTYASKSLGRPRELVVYTPPGYQQQADTSFPTLFLQHGMGDNQATWTAHGKAHWVLDNLIALGGAKPMVVVMMDGHAAADDSPGGFASNTGLFERDLIEDVLPFVESNYRVKTDADSRAIVGLSMGGGQSLTIGLNHPDHFAWVGGFSSAVPSGEAVADAIKNAQVTNQKLKLLWIGCGQEDFLLRANDSFIARLKESDVRHEWHLTEGNHSWPVWRGYLADFVPKLFRH